MNFTRALHVRTSLRGIRRRILMLGCLLGSLSLVTVLLPTTSASAASAPGVTSNSILIGNIGSFSGPIADEFATFTPGLLTAFALQNAKGGVYGRKLKVVNADDQVSTTVVLTAAQTLIGKGVFAIANNSPVLFAASTYLKNQGVPVVGQATDGGPEWTPANPDLFAVGGSSEPPTTFTGAVAFGKFFKGQGVTNLGAICNTFQSAVNVVVGAQNAARYVGLKATYLNTSIPATQVSNFSGVVAAMKAQGVNGVMTGWGIAQGFGLLSAIKTGGLKLKALIMASAPSPAELESASTRAAAQGTWQEFGVVPPEVNTPATRTLIAAVKKYQHQTLIPDAGEVSGYMTGLAIIQGLELAGKNPTRAAFIKDLRNVTNFTGGGMMISPQNFKTSNATGEGAGPAPKDCDWFAQYVGDKYVPQAKPICAGGVPSSFKGLQKPTL